MKIASLLMLAVAVPASVLAQTPAPAEPAAPDSLAAAAPAPEAAAPGTVPDTLAPDTPAAALDLPPAGLAAAEIARSQRCVAVVARMAALDAEIEPEARKAQRLRELVEGVLLEDSTRVTPFDAADTVDVAVQAWFVADQELARAALEAGDTVQAERAAARQEIEKLLQDALAEISQRGQEKLAATGDLAAAYGECDDVVFVRSAVLETCAAQPDGPLCEQARVQQPSADGFRFVEVAEDLWDMESLRPWSSPSRLAVTSDGALAGGQTAALARRGNVVLAVGIEPIIRDRASVSAEELPLIQASLDTLGFVSGDTARFVIPALVIDLVVGAPIGGETHYLLHFGDLSNPGQQVVWSAPATSAPIQARIPAPKAALDGLAAGEQLHLTAITLDPATSQGEAIYSLDVTPVAQAAAVNAVVEYMKTGELARDLAALLGQAAPQPPGQ